MLDAPTPAQPELRHSGLPSQDQAVQLPSFGAEASVLCRGAAEFLTLSGAAPKPESHAKASAKTTFLAEPSNSQALYHPQPFPILSPKQLQTLNCPDA